MIRALWWAARALLASYLLGAVVLLALLSWLPVVGKPARALAGALVRCVGRLLGFKMTKGGRR